jgi:putative N-acetyltransferase (TIGR04045 family)
METVSSSPTTASAVCRLVDGPDDLSAHFAVRRRVFVADQGLFAVTDKDERDWADGTLHVVGLADGLVAGAVRLYPLDADGLWKGDRLAVLPEARVQRLGALLVQFAVATAGERGGHTMLAQIQVPNVRFFEHLGWHADGPPAPYHGVMHQPMAIPLAPAP